MTDQDRHLEQQGFVLPDMQRRELQASPNVHYVLDIRVQRVEMVTTKVGGVLAQAKEATDRRITELGHVVLSEKDLQYLLKKGAKALELIGE